MAVSLISTGVQFPDSTIQTTASGASGLNLVTTVTASGAATADVENAMTAYDRYVITFDGVTSSVAPGSLYATLKIGGTYRTDAFYYWVGGQFYSGTSSTTYIRAHPGSSMTLVQNQFDTGASNNVSGYIYLSTPSSATHKRVWGQLAYTFQGGGGFRDTVFGGQYENIPSSTLTGVRFYTDGTITGTFRLYGYAK